MHADFAEWPEAIHSTTEIAERTDIEIPLGQILLPSFPTENGESESEMLPPAGLRGSEGALRGSGAGRGPGADGVRARRDRGHGIPVLLPDRLGLHPLREENGIAVGPGRGSAAGSIVSYSLGITDLDPVEHDLLFERFLNPGRKSMPDIDIDFSVRGRDRMIAYVTDKYGADSVAQIITFGKMAPRAAVRDAARVHGFDYSTGDRLAKEIPGTDHGPLAFL